MKCVFCKQEFDHETNKQGRLEAINESIAHTRAVAEKYAAAGDDVDPSIYKPIGIEQVADVCDACFATECNKPPPEHFVNAVAAIGCRDAFYCHRCDGVRVPGHVCRCWVCRAWGQPDGSCRACKRDAIVAELWLYGYFG